MDDMILFRPPAGKDARAMRQLAKDSNVLSVNSSYFYSLMSRHFQATCLVADSADGLCAYVIAYKQPEQPGTLFVWQVGTGQKWQKRGIARQLLVALIKKIKPEFVEATIASGNHQSINLFKSLARHVDAPYVFSNAPYFTEGDLGEGEEAEHLMRIGPIAKKF